MMCDFNNCNKSSHYFYRLGEVRFEYCQKHSRIPEFMIKKIEEGYYKVKKREKDAKNIQNFKRSRGVWTEELLHS